MTDCSLYGRSRPLRLTTANYANNVSGSWEELAQRLPNLDRVGDSDPSITDQVGGRDVDRQADWRPRIAHIELDTDFWKEMKTAFPADLRADAHGRVREDLQAKQRLFYDTVVNHFSNIVQGLPTPQLLLHLDGEGGTGKTVTIMTVCEHLEKMAADNGLGIPVIRAAPTGVAAHGINGKTLHSLFRLPLKAAAYERLTSQNALSLQQTFREV